MYSVYKHTNKATGKVYIGMTKLDPKVRWSNGGGYRNQPDFFSDILKYGWDNFDHEILFDNLTKVEARVKESELIKQQTNCYNHNAANFDEEGNPIYEYESYYKAKGKPRVYCIELDESWVSAAEAYRATKVDPSAILKVCRGQRQSAGKHPTTNEPLHWKFLDK